MPVTPTFPGVYIEEVPSAVRTIVGVSTSVTAFIGYTRRGETDKAVQVFGYGDFERSFGGLDPESPMSYAVRAFFQNGGREAWIVRVAQGAAAAAVTLRNEPQGTQTPVLTVRAASKGAWGNALRVEVDYDAANPEDLFNLTVTEFREQNGQLIAGTPEVHRNLSMDDESPRYAVDAIEANSSLITAERPAGAPGAAAGIKGVALSRPRNGSEYPLGDIDSSHNRLAITVNGDGPHEFNIDPAAFPAALTPVATRLLALANEIEAKANAVVGPDIDGDTDTTGLPGSQISLRFRSNLTGEHASVVFSNASQRNAAALLGLGLANGGREIAAAALLRPAASGTLGGALETSLGSGGLAGLDRGASPSQLTVAVRAGEGTPVNATVTLMAAADPPPTSKSELRAMLENAIRRAPDDPANAAVAAAIRAQLEGTRVLLEADRLRVVPGGPPEANFAFIAIAGPPADGTATLLGLPGDGDRNVAQYTLGVGGTARAQLGPSLGDDGTPPGVNEFRGVEADRTGLYALNTVDLFNILCIPGQSDETLLAEAMTYCEDKRAFMIVDLPDDVQTVPEAQDWIKDPGTPKSKNAAGYFPWVILPDPLRQYRTYPYPPSGMIAGLYARTDGTRGIWKAPAGTEAFLRGPDSLVYKLSDDENGTLNPLGLNAIRALPNYGHVAWGARTLVGSDQAASEWKYIPVRRTALYIEESLFRGTQWVVFEPNDEPLWAQIRLNVGAFMQSLFRQGAFQGKSPREAYLVKCDSETTTQDDINRGIVNILVGFAPLKPAEFVIIKITQLAGQVET